MTSLYVAWQQPDSREWIPVAHLEYQDARFFFRYTRGVFRAKDFRPFGRMDSLASVYESDTIFPFFANRLISRSRPEFKSYLRWVGLDGAGEHPMEILALTGGVRGTDSIELFAPPTISDNNNYSVNFFARSLRYLPAETLSLIDTLESGTELFLMGDSQNIFDQFAVALRIQKPVLLVGYCPKYYAKDLNALLTDRNNKLKASVTCVNKDAPLGMRLRCNISAKIPENFRLFDKEEDFKPIDDRDVPSSWNDFAEIFN